MRPTRVFMNTRTSTLTLLATATLASCAHPLAAGSCGYEVVHIAAVAPREFAGRAAAIEIRLHSERDDAKVESFPDSALVIRRPSGTCEADGGVWQRNGIFVAADGRTVAAIESSGSNDILVFFDAESCRRVGDIDVSSARWRFDDHGVAVTLAAGAAGSPRVHRLDAACRPQPQP